jgi:hypothetical protein
MATNRTEKTNTQQGSNPEHIEADKDPSTDKKKSTKPRHFRKTAQAAIGQNYELIVAKFAEEARNGSVQHTKLLFDLGGVKEEVSAASSKRRKAPSLGKLLLAEAKAMRRNKDKSLESSETH